MTIVGFAIVLLTFVVKEVFRDQLQDLRDSIDHEQQVIDLGDTRDQMQLETVASNQRIQQLKDLLAAPEARIATSRGDLLYEISNLRQVEASTDDRLKRVSDMLQLLDGVKQADQLRQTRDQLQADLGEAETETHGRIAQCIGVTSPTVKDHALILGELLSVTLLDLRVMLWQDSVVGFAQNLKATAGRVYNFCTRAAYALYVAGLLLGLVGALSGLKLGSEDG